MTGVFCDCCGGPMNSDQELKLSIHSNAHNCLYVFEQRLAAAESERDALNAERTIHDAYVSSIEQRLAAAEALAYIGDHHFPDLTYKARLEETVARLAAAEHMLAAAETEHANQQRYITSLQERLLATEARCEAQQVKVRELELRSTAAETRYSNVSRLYEELRTITDGGSVSMTHEDAVASLRAIEDQLEAAESQLRRGVAHAQERVDLLARLAAADRVVSVRKCRGCDGYYPVGYVCACGEDNSCDPENDGD